MDYLGGASTPLVNIPAAISSSGNLLERIIGVAVALAVDVDDAVPDALCAL